MMSFHSPSPFLVSTGAPSLTFQIRKVKLESTFEGEHAVLNWFAVRGQPHSI